MNRKLSLYLFFLYLFAAFAEGRYIPKSSSSSSSKKNIFESKTLTTSTSKYHGHKTSSTTSSSSSSSQKLLSTSLSTGHSSLGSGYSTTSTTLSSSSSSIISSSSSSVSKKNITMHGTVSYSSTASGQSTIATDVQASSSPDLSPPMGLMSGDGTSSSTAAITSDNSSPAEIIMPDTSKLISLLKSLESMDRPDKSSLLKWAADQVPSKSESAYIAYSKSLATMCDIIMNEYSTFGKCLSGDSRFKNFDSGFWYSSIKFLCYYTGNTESTKTFQLHNTIGSVTMEIAPSIASLMSDVSNNIPFSSLYNGEKIDIDKTTDYLLQLKVRSLKAKGSSNNVNELDQLNSQLGVSSLDKRSVTALFGSKLLAKSIPDVKLCHQFESRTNEVTKCSMTVQYARLSALCELGFFVKNSASVSQASQTLANPAFYKAIKAYLNDNSTEISTSESSNGISENTVSSGSIHGEVVTYNNKQLKEELSNIKDAEGLTTAEIVEFSKDVVNITGQYYYDRYSRVFAELCENTIGLLHPFGECLKKEESFSSYNGTMWAKAFTYDYCGAYNSVSKNFKSNFFKLQIPQTSEMQSIYVPPDVVSALLTQQKTTSFVSLINSDGTANGGKTGDFLISLNKTESLDKRLFGFSTGNSCTQTCNLLKDVKKNNNISSCWGEASMNLAQHACLSVCKHFHIK